MTESGGLFLALFCVHTLCLAALSNGFILDTIDANRTVVQVLTVGNGGQWGTWGPPEYCPRGYFANGFRIKLESNQGDGDDTAMNGIRLICRRSTPDVNGSATSKVGPWGNWLNKVSCNVTQNHYLTAFRIEVDKSEGLFTDDTAVDYIQFLCRSFTGGPASTAAQDIGFGTWGPYSASCPQNSAICGLSTKVEEPQNIGGFNTDDTALNDVVFYCCSD